MKKKVFTNVHSLFLTDTVRKLYYKEYFYHLNKKCYDQLSVAVSDILPWHVFCANVPVILSSEVKFETVNT